MIRMVSMPSRAGASNHFSLPPIAVISSSGLPFTVNYQNHGTQVSRAALIEQRRQADRCQLLLVHLINEEWTLDVLLLPLPFRRIHPR